MLDQALTPKPGPKDKGLLLLAGLLLLTACASPPPPAAPTMAATEISSPTEAATAIQPSSTPAAATQPPPTATLEEPSQPAPSAAPTDTQQASQVENLPGLSAGQAVSITTITMLNNANGWALGGLRDPGDRVLRTRDGGQTWSEVTPPEPAPPQDEAIAASGFFLDIDTAWIVYHPVDEVVNPGETLFSLVS